MSVPIRLVCFAIYIHYDRFVTWFYDYSCIDMVRFLFQTRQKNDESMTKHVKDKSVQNAEGLLSHFDCTHRSICIVTM